VEEALPVDGTASVEQLRALVAVRRGTVVYECRAVDGVVEGTADATSTRDRYAIVRHFLHTFLAEPLVGAFTGLDRAAIADFAKQLIFSSSTGEWLSAAGAVKSVAIVWPFLRLVGKTNNADPLLLRAIGELLLLAESVDTLWETKWHSLASDTSLAFETQWREASTARYSA